MTPGDLRHLVLHDQDADILVVVGTPGDGDSIVWNESAGQWEPGAGGGGTDLTAYIGLTEPVGYESAGTFYDPGSAAWDDAGWFSFEYPPDADATLTVGSGGDTAALAVLRVTESTGHSELYLGPYADGGFIDLLAISGSSVSATVQAAASQTGPLLDLIADGGSHVLRATGNNKLGFFNAAAAARPTGVAVTAAGVHAALVTLGLITA